MKNMILFALSLAFASASAQAMPRVDISCQTTDSNEGTSLKFGVSRYSGDLYEDTVFYDDEDVHQVAAKSLAGFKNADGELYLKFYEDFSHGGDIDLTGYKLNAKKSGQGWVGTLTFFQVVANPGPEKNSKPRPVKCKFEE